MTVGTNAGTRVFIGTTTRFSTLTGYRGDTWTEVGEVEDSGEFGDESAAVTFTSLKDARTRKMKGPRDAGTMAIVTGDDMIDAGQTALEAAEASPLDFNFKVVLNNAITLAGNPSEHYFFGKLMGKRRNTGNATNVIRRTWNVGINSAIIEVDPT